MSFMDNARREAERLYPYRIELAADDDPKLVVENSQRRAGFLRGAIFCAQCMHGVLNELARERPWYVPRDYLATIARRFGIVLDEK